MTDEILFAIGCGVTFLFLVGGYIAFRASFAADSSSGVQGST
ncbi:MAG: hypothetical protein P8L45_07965 [Longimicrobiales bacterium]|nr:hypothetical protein [Longimicrobiales bacterium]